MRQNSNCRIHDWAGLRRALGLVQFEMAALMGYDSAASIHRLETDPDRAPRPVYLARLRRQLARPKWRARLQSSGYPYPYRQDWLPKEARVTMTNRHEDLNEFATDGLRVRTEAMSPFFDVVRRYPGWVVRAAYADGTVREMDKGGFHATFQRAILYAQFFATGSPDLTEYLRAWDRLPGARRELAEREHDLIRATQLGASGSDFTVLSAQISALHDEIARLEAFVKTEPVDVEVEVIVS